MFPDNWETETIVGSKELDTEKSIGLSKVKVTEVADVVCIDVFESTYKA